MGGELTPWLEKINVSDNDLYCSDRYTSDHKTMYREVTLPELRLMHFEVTFYNHQQDRNSASFPEGSSVYTAYVVGQA